VDTSSFDYALPEARIAQHPIEPRDAARLLVDRGPGSPPDHRRVADLPTLLGPGDVVVVNTTKVIPARLALRRPTGGAAEVLLLGPLGAHWEALVRPSRKVAPGTVLQPAEPMPSGPAAGFTVTVGDDLGEGRRIVDVHGVADVFAALEVIGAMPLPPYITEPLEDDSRYQTVYAKRPASAAAPTAGLHLTIDVLDRLADRGIPVVELELEVGLGTFRPIATDLVEDHVMHAERYRVPDATADACRAADRVVAIGTTTVRALESAAATGASSGSTDLFIHGDRPFAAVDVLLTNFHQPRSSLLVLIDAFVGPHWRDLYAEALAGDYRFLSFGDAMLLTGRGRVRS